MKIRLTNATTIIITVIIFSSFYLYHGVSATYITVGGSMSQAIGSSPDSSSPIIINSTPANNTTTDNDSRKSFPNPAGPPP